MMKMMVMMMVMMDDDDDADDDHVVDGRHEVMWRMLEQIPNSRLGQLAR